MPTLRVTFSGYISGTDAYFCGFLLGPVHKFASFSVVSFWDRCISLHPFLWFPSGTGAYVCILFCGFLLGPVHMFASFSGADAPDIYLHSTCEQALYVEQVCMVKTPLYPVYPFPFTRVLRVVYWNGTGVVYVQKFCTPREILLKNTHLKKSRTACTFRWISGTEYTFQVIHPPWPIAVKKLSSAPPCQSYIRVPPPPPPWISTNSIKNMLRWVEINSVTHTDHVDFISLIITKSNSRYAVINRWLQGLLTHMTSIHVFWKFYNSSARSAHVRNNFQKRVNKNHMRAQPM